MKTKNSPITQEVQHVLGAQCQEQRTKIKHILLLYHTTQGCFICMSITICLFCCSILKKILYTSLVCPCCCCSVTKSCRTLYNPMDFSTPGCSVIHPLSPRVCSNSCPLSWWCYLTISSSVPHFSSCLQSFPASGSFPELALCIKWPKYWSFSFSMNLPLNNNVSHINKIMLSYLTNNNNLILSNVPYAKISQSSHRYIYNRLTQCI